MKRLLDLNAFDVLSQITTVHHGLLSVEQHMRYLMFMQAIAEMSEAHGWRSKKVIDQLDPLILEHSGEAEIDYSLLSRYARLADLTFNLLH
jgi:hypothetical protein